MPKRPFKRGKPLLSLHSFLTLIPARPFIPFNLCFSFCLLLPTLHLPHSLNTPVSASLRSLCSPLGVADDRRLGGSTLRLCPNTASPIHCFDALANLQHSLWHLLVPSDTDCDYTHAKRSAQIQLLWANSKAYAQIQATATTATLHTREQTLHRTMTLNLIFPSAKCRLRTRILAYDSIAAMHLPLKSWLYR